MTNNEITTAPSVLPSETDVFVNGQERGRIYDNGKGWTAYGAKGKPAKFDTREDAIAHAAKK
jgi:hypothetical protein